MTAGKNTGPTQQPPIGLGYMPVLFAAGVALAWFSACTVGALAGTGGRWRPHNLRELLDYTTSMFHPSDTLRAHGVLGPWAGATTVVTFAAIAVVTFLVAASRIRDVSARRRGLAQREDLEQMSADAHLARAHFLRPGSTGVRSPYATGVALGRAHTGQGVWASIEDTFSVIGPPRSGKTARLVAPTVARWEGPVVVTGLRPDIVGWTADWRTRGRRLLFDPADTTDPPAGFERVRWTPLVGCTDELTALQRANALFAGRPNPSGDEAYWRQEGRNVLCAYLLAAARADLTMMQVVEWANRSDDTEPVAVLSQLDDSGLWSNSLRAAIANEPRYKAGVWGQVKQALEPFYLPTVRAVAGGRAAESFTADWFLEDWHTLYMLGSPSEQQAVAGLCAALADHVVETARRRARAHGRLSTPLLLALDEAANVAPIPKLDQLMSTGGGSGICTMLVVQSVDQARNTWGPGVGEALLRDLATQRLVLGGLGSAKDLKDITSLLGEHDEIVRSVSSRGGRGLLASGDISVNTRLRPVLTENQIRELDTQGTGEALLIPRAGKAAVVRLPAIWEGDLSKSR